ncbi:MAG TPA: membrane protein insertase YidC [Steroidobacteraceae bacterium]|nr:membrane protein insertase YidC [Steroidobacteraceae bacterium]
MTNNIRVFLWLGLALAVWLNYSQWQQDYGPKPVPPTTLAPGAPKPASMEDTVPQAAQTTAANPAATSDSVPTAAVPAAPADASAAIETAGLVHVVTDVLEIDIDLKGGTLVRAALRGYPIVKGQPDPVVLFNRDGADTNYVLQTGLSAAKAGERAPTHLETFTSAATSYELAAGQDELRVPLTWTDGNGVTVAKTFVFHRSAFDIDLDYAVDNQSAAPWTVSSYARIVRTDPPVERSMFKVESYAFRGPAIWAPDKAGGDNIYRRLKIEKPDDIKIPSPVENGWLAGMQHHFVSAIIPAANRKYTYSLNVKDRQYMLGAVGPVDSIAPNAKGEIKEKLFVGPKLQKQLISLHPELYRVADYGVLTMLSRPLFLLLDFLHSLVRNWGLAIIFATFLLKLAFYPLSEKAGRSMARMRALAPRMKALQEQYKDDRTKLGQATMDLYKTEKVNPVAGCLPMIIQMPVFLAFYWVLLESTEMRQAPFLGWINDLSSRDPFFILPALNGLAMWFQQKLNPPPPDPMQAKLFQFMPVVFSVMFAFFPAGLVLYWVTNTGLSILQQWNINRKIAAEDASRRR